MKQNMFLAVGFLFIFLFISGHNEFLYPFSDQTNTERIIKENKYFIDFLNITITNFGDNKKDEFKKAYGKHFNAEVAFLQSDYPRAYKRIYTSQADLVKLYEDILKNKYLEDSKEILDKLAPSIIRSKNPKAKHYLTLGYRDRTLGWNHYTVGDSTNPKQYSVKLLKYEEAIKMVRRAKRYAFLALYESQNNENKKKIFNHMLKTEKDTGNLFYVRFVELKEDAVIEEMTKEFSEKDKNLKPDDKKKKSVEEDDSYENLILRRVRFKKEKIVAKSLLNFEFDKAEYEMRQYIKDYNYKLLISTFEIMGEEDKKQKSELSLNYSNLKVHLMDNYLRLSKESALIGIVGNVKVEDSIESAEKTKKEDEDKKIELKDKEKTSIKESDKKTEVKDKDKNSGIEPVKKLEKKVEEKKDKVIKSEK